MLCTANAPFFVAHLQLCVYLILIMIYDTEYINTYYNSTYYLPT